MAEIHPERDYHAFLAEGRFMIQRSRSSGRHVFYPRLVEPLTGADDLEWVEASGKGTVYSATVIRPRPPAVPYNVVLVDLEEGPRIMSRVDGMAEPEVPIGLAVMAKIIQEDDKPLIVFEPG
ncbi:MAG: OB-fold domain-containing protein [Sphingomicrobium sp.]